MATSRSSGPFRWPADIAGAVGDLGALMRISRDTVMNVGSYRRNGVWYAKALQMKKIVGLTP